MGYTHYWDIRKPLTEKVLGDIAEKTRNIIGLAKEDGINIVGGLGYFGSEPIIQSDEICLNGEGDDSHETFYLKVGEKGFGFTKTARKPYDAVVTSILKYCKDTYPTYFNVSSDGGKDAIDCAPYDVANVN